ncbi:MAG: DoxX family membrane protein [Proteobacteria bacterium]|nr:DoxX family membrane protein [Pseudomonadota bacterium]
MRDNQLKQRLAWVQLILRIVLGATFIWASVDKILNPAQFAKIIYGYGVFPEISINVIAIFLPYLECLTGFCLITGIFPKSSLAIINGLLVGFILLIGFNLLRGHTFDCGCFSVSDTQTAGSAWSLLIRDVLLLAAGIYLWIRFEPLENRFS